MINIDAHQRHLLLEGIYLRYGYDFRQYAVASLDRRIVSILQRYQLQTPLQLLNEVYHDRKFFSQILPHLTINTTEAFRDPSFFKALRTDVFPLLRTYPNLRIWIAGCSTGEEVYSIAIQLHEENLLARTTIFATDVNSNVLSVAKDGIYNLDMIQAFTKNYTAAGGTRNPSDYYTAEYGLARMDPELRRNIVFTPHNLAIDGVFTEAHLILCRNVMIYFSRELQDKVLELFDRSLVPRGFLALGSKETVRFSIFADRFSSLDPEQKIYQRGRP